MLNDQICEQLAEIAPFQLRAYVFLNKRGLADALGRCGQPIAKNKLDDFVLGINQAAERFWVVDVGYGKEAADGKVRSESLSLQNAPCLTCLQLVWMMSSGFPRTSRSSLQVRIVFHTSQSHSYT